MKFITPINNLIQELLATNQVFKENGVFYSTQDEFEGGGLKSTLLNFFYIRPISNGWKVKMSGGMRQSEVTLRLVMQLEKEFCAEDALVSLMSQMENQCNADIEVIAFDCDSQRIYEDEYDEKYTRMNFNLLRVDFKLTQEGYFSTCNPICYAD